jgi:energy-coupling factor transporter transmembrane protein EcfT
VAIIRDGWPDNSYSHTVWAAVAPSLMLLVILSIITNGTKENAANVFLVCIIITFLAVFKLSKLQNVLPFASTDE